MNEHLCHNTISLSLQLFSLSLSRFHKRIVCSDESSDCKRSCIEDIPALPPTAWPPNGCVVDLTGPAEAHPPERAARPKAKPFAKAAGKAAAAKAAPAAKQRAQEAVHSNKCCNVCYLAHSLPVYVCAIGQCQGWHAEMLQVNLQPKLGESQQLLSCAPPASACLTRCPS